MKIEGTPKEIADFVNAIHSQPAGVSIDISKIDNDDKYIEEFLKGMGICRKPKGGF